MIDTNDMAMSADGLLARAEAAARGAGDRLDAIVADLFLPRQARLSDRQRTTMGGLLDALVAGIEADLRSHLVGDLPDAPEFPPDIMAMLASPRIVIAGPIIARARLLRDPELIAAVLRRADEHLLVQALRLSSEDAGFTIGDPVGALARSTDAEIAARATALLVAESRRFDRFQEPLLTRDDLPAEIAHRLTWTVAAALRHHLQANAAVNPALCDRRIAAAASRSLAAYDEGATIEARAMQLALRLAQAGQLYDDLLEAALDQARLALFVAGLALRAGLDHATAWDMAFDRAHDRLTILLRAIDMRRKGAAAILLRLDPLAAPERVAARMDAYDALDAARAREALRPCRLDPGFRAAITGVAMGLAAAGLDGDHG